MPSQVSSFAEIPAASPFLREVASDLEFVSQGRDILKGVQQTLMIFHKTRLFLARKGDKSSPELPIFFVFLVLAEARNLPETTFLMADFLESKASTKDEKSVIESFKVNLPSLYNGLMVSVGCDRTKPLSLSPDPSFP